MEFLEELHSLDWVRGAFSMFSLQITIEDENNEKNLPTIIHEYTHYIQTMNTFTGLIEFEEYIRYFSRCFCKMGVSQDKVEPPYRDFLVKEMKHVNFDNLLRRKSAGMTIHDGEYVFDNSDKDDYTLIKEKYFDPYNQKEIFISFISLDDYKIPLNEVVIKENMAMISSVITEKKKSLLTDDEINQIISWPYREYIVILDFIHNYLGEKNTLELVYKICDIALNLVPCEVTIFKILEYVQTNQSLLLKLSEDNILSRIMEMLNYKNIFEAYKIGYSKIQSTTNETINKILSHDRNDFLKVLQRVYNFCCTSIYKNNPEDSLFNKLQNQNLIESNVPSTSFCN